MNFYLSIDQENTYPAMEGWRWERRFYKSEVIYYDDRPYFISFIQSLEPEEISGGVLREDQVKKLKVIRTL